MWKWNTATEQNSFSEWPQFHVLVDTQYSHFWASDFTDTHNITHNKQEKMYNSTQKNLTLWQTNWT